MSTGCESEVPDDFAAIDVSLKPEPDAPKSEKAIIAFCGDCHVMPLPQSFGKDRWHKEVVQGFRLYTKSGRTDLVKPDFDATLAYFRDDAPQAWTFDPIDSTPDEQFVRTEFAWRGDQKPVQISHVAIAPTQDETLQLEMTDMWTGNLFTADVDQDSMTASLLGNVAHPAHLDRVDLNGDGIDDYVVADLGTFNPQASEQSSVWFLQGTESGDFKRWPIKLGLSRVAGIQPIDHDSDGDMDLVVSDFGRHYVGSIYLLTNLGNKDGVPQFDWKVLDSRPGAIETPIVDMNGDGRPDIVTLVSQHHETVEVHLNQGNGVFEAKAVYQADDPSHGSSGIEVVDLDGDGDLDVVYTNGDTFDDTYAKPFHYVRWFENEGTYPFKHHPITSMPGVYCAVTGDIDLDGDLDIAAVALLGDPEVAKRPTGTFDGVIWLEQTESKAFKRHTIVANDCQAATCQLMDCDQDGDLDLFLPPYRFGRTPTEKVVVYLNKAK